MYRLWRLTFLEYDLVSSSAIFVVPIICSWPDLDLNGTWYLLRKFIDTGNSGRDGITTG